MAQTLSYSFFLQTTDQLPLHLKDRAPFLLVNTEAIFRRPEKEAIAEDGRVLMAGALEFQTQITPGVLADVCDPGELYKTDHRTTHRFRCVYDPEIQRGIKDSPKGQKEFLRDAQIESMMEDIMQNRFECPQLMWNLRAGDCIWSYVREKRELRIYEGVATRPDTNHRHHAIVRVHRRYRDWVRDTASEIMGEYNPHRAYGLVVYTDDFRGEAHRFFVYNFKGWRVPTSTAHYIESKTASPHVHSKLARELMERSTVLGAENVEVMTNHLSRNSAKMITFGTLVDAINGGFPNVHEENYDEIRDFLLVFLEGLGTVRSDEIGKFSVAKRQAIRNKSVADQAVLWHAYFRLAQRIWQEKLEWSQVLVPFSESYSEGKFKGDPFSRNNPAWQTAGVIATGKKGPRVVNNRQARQGVYEFLCKLAGIAERQLLPN